MYTYLTNGARRHSRWLRRRHDGIPAQREPHPLEGVLVRRPGTRPVSFSTPGGFGPFQRIGVILDGVREIAAFALFAHALANVVDDVIDVRFEERTNDVGSRQDLLRIANVEFHGGREAFHEGTRAFGETFEAGGAQERLGEIGGNEASW